MKRHEHPYRDALSVLLCWHEAPLTNGDQGSDRIDVRPDKFDNPYGAIAFDHTVCDHDA